MRLRLEPRPTLSASAAVVAPLRPVVGVWESVDCWGPDWGTPRRECFCLESLASVEGPWDDELAGGGGHRRARAGRGGIVGRRVREVLAGARRKQIYMTYRWRWRGRRDLEPCRWWTGRMRQQVAASDRNSFFFFCARMASGERARERRRGKSGDGAGSEGGRELRGGCRVEERPRAWLAAGKARRGEGGRVSE